MNRRTVYVCGLVGAFLLPLAAEAQESGDTGLVVATPASIGLVWHATDRLAIRPDVSFGFTATDGQDVGPDIDSRSVTLGVSALVSVRQWNDLRAYITPKYSYSRASTSLSGSLGELGDSRISSSAVSGSFGVQYSLGSRFGVFGETGLQYSRQKSVTPNLLRDVERITTTVGSRSALGVVFYF